MFFYYKCEPRELVSYGMVNGATCAQHNRRLVNDVDVNLAAGATARMLSNHWDACSQSAAAASAGYNWLLQRIILFQFVSFLHH